MRDRKVSQPELAPPKPAHAAKAAGTQQQAIREPPPLPVQISNLSEWVAAVIDIVGQDAVRARFVVRGQDRARQLEQAAATAKAPAKRLKKK